MHLNCALLGNLALLVIRDEYSSYLRERGKSGSLRAVLHLVFCTVVAPFFRGHLQFSEGKKIVKIIRSS